jgi:hypothetical protein
VDGAAGQICSEIEFSGITSLPRGSQLASKQDPVTIGQLATEILHSDPDPTASRARHGTRIDAVCFQDQGGLLAFEHRIGDHGALDHEMMVSISKMSDVIRGEKAGVNLILKAGRQKQGDCQRPRGYRGKPPEKAKAGPQT